MARLGLPSGVFPTNAQRPLTTPTHIPVTSLSSVTSSGSTAPGPCPSTAEPLWAGSLREAHTGGIHGPGGHSVPSTQDPVVVAHHGSESFPELVPGSVFLGYRTCVPVEQRGRLGHRLRSPVSPLHRWQGLRPSSASDGFWERRWVSGLFFHLVSRDCVSLGLPGTWPVHAPQLSPLFIAVNARNTVFIILTICKCAILRHRTHSQYCVILRMCPSLPGPSSARSPPPPRALALLPVSMDLSRAIS